MRKDVGEGADKAADDATFRPRFTFSGPAILDDCAGFELET